MDERERKERDNRDNSVVFERHVKAGKRTYFVDVKTSKDGEYYLVLTESKKKIDEYGNFVYDKHKIFLYKEDLGKFMDGVQEAIDFIKKEQPFNEEEYAEKRRKWHEEKIHNNPPSSPASENTSAKDGSGFKDVSFDDLG